VAPIRESILVVDDDERFRERLARALRTRGFEVSVAEDHPSGMAVAGDARPQRAIVDLNMPGPSGMQLVKDLLAEQPQMRILVLTGYGSVATAVDAIRLGAVNFLAKPAHADQILAAFDPPPPAEEVEADEDYEPASLARAEWEHIQRVLSDCGGNVSQAARKLGLHRRTLQRKLNKYPPNE
jgi:two-component system response regulator RegA